MENAMRAEVLAQALPYIQNYAGKTVVVKFGGSAMVSQDLCTTVMHDITLLSQIGVRTVLVHGGGPEISDLLRRLNRPSRFVNGLRVTDAETMEAAQMVLCGKINKNLVAQLHLSGGRAIGLCGIDGYMMQVRCMDPELGFVGEVTSIDPRPITDMLALGYIPVVSSVGCDEKGNAYNVNADTAAAAIAAALDAECLVAMTDTEGILMDRNDPSTLISHIHPEEVDGLIQAGVISGGMIPKIECCRQALEQGVKKVFIIDGRVRHSILIELLTNEGMGTMFQ